MTNSTDKELAAILIGISEWPLLKTEPIFEHEREALRQAAARLEARGEITEAMDAVAAERRRQETIEGFTAKNDDQYVNGELAIAAGCYAIYAEAGYRTIMPPIWPWHKQWWKPRDQRFNLVRAAALILAEIERFDRRAALEAAQKGETP